ncbi:MAG: hypothetical protein U1C50_02905 [Patescibacteria group bacterium]|nr:hypothetical protein [Patescibacteria group bacterium]
MEILEKIKTWYRGLPDKKRYFEVISAALTIPVLATVLITNVWSLKHKDQSPSPSPEEKSSEKVQVIIVSSPEPNSAANPTPSPTAACKEEVGPVSIASPQENEVVTQDPIVVEISRPDDSYCDIVWSYRINSGPWSNYTNREISLYGLTSGDKTLEVKVKSQVGDRETTLRRHFTVETTNASPISTPSGTLN